MMVSRTGRRSGAGGIAQGCRQWCLGTLAAMLLAWVVPAANAVGAGEPLRIPLEPMGFQTLSPEFLLAGSSMLTVDFVDKDHLLVTFGMHRLMKRDANDPADDADRTVGAFVVELPSGKVLARTEWRLHDRARYLWNLGHGRFMLRVRDQLTMFAPLAADPNDTFHEVPLLKSDRHVVAVLVSADADLLTVESTKWAMGSGETSEGFSADPAPVQISFYRLINQGPAADQLIVSWAGTIRTKTAIMLPLTAAGRLDILDGGKDRWLFNFDEHAGNVDELAEFDTSCFPRPVFVGHAEFVVFGCRGATDKVDFAGFNLKGDEMWQQNFYEAFVNPTFEFAPEAGRFALGRTIVSGEFDPGMPLPESVVTAQEVRVYQSYNGKQVFKIECTPVERAGQNFALSSDGMRLAAVRESLVRHAATKDTPEYTQNEAAVEVYALPALTAEDKAALKDTQQHAPVDTGARIDLALSRNPRSGNSSPAAEPGSPVKMEPEVDPTASATRVEEPSAPTAPAADAGADAAPSGPSEGDPQTTGPRKPPTLYGPDEKQPASKPQ